MFTTVGVGEGPKGSGAKKALTGFESSSPPRDATEGNAVTYRINVRSVSSELAYRSGETTSGTVSTTFRVRPKKNTRSVRLVTVASDPLGNERTITRRLNLPS